MKKFIYLILTIFLITGCSSKMDKKIQKEFKDNVNSSKSYVIAGTLDIFNDEDKFNYDITVSYKKGDYYNDRKNKMWIVEVISLVLFILAGLLTTMNLYYENDIQVLVLGYFFLIHGMLELFDPIVISLKIK